MKALSLTQPWASLVALSAKRIETRSWPTHYRGWLAIHAAKGLADLTEQDYRDLVMREPFWSALGRPIGPLPRGAIVAVCRIVACVPTAPLNVLSAQERAFGNFAPGRWAWELCDVIRLPAPIPARGMQGLWEWDAPPAVRALLEAAHAPG